MVQPPSDTKPRADIPPPPKQEVSSLQPEISTTQSTQDQIIHKTASNEKNAMVPDPIEKLLQEADSLVQKSAGLKTVDPFVRSWAEAWQQKDVENYLAHYSNDFKPSRGLSLSAWQKQRHKRLQKPKFIKIKIRDIQKKAISDSRVLVTFNQKYQSNTYSDQVIKTLDLQWDKDGWTILKETSKAM
jgi:murein L,D-transpeptidase YafK